MTTPPIYCVMPILSDPEVTEAAIGDLLAQSVPTRVLLVNQGVDDPFRDRLERLAEQYSPQILLWSHQPPLPSLGATWNRALDGVWEAGGTEALVVNNDVRLAPLTVQVLSTVRARTAADFVTAVAVTAEQFATTGDLWAAVGEPCRPEQYPRGGPDFSCFLISRAGHEKYRFDEGFIPAFCEDLDMHRRYLLGGDGDKIFSVNLPYRHLASNTLKTIDAGRAAMIRQQIEQVSRQHYLRKWGGPVNQETYWQPWQPEAERPPRWDGVERPTTPALQATVQAQAVAQDDRVAHDV